ncbi:MAG: hypothetical protein RIC55_26670 [Pirellulaceae bacterium]
MSSKPPVFRATFFGASMLLLTLVGAAAPSATFAGPPHVQFDAAYVVACRDVTTEEFARANPYDRLVEARIDISALLRHGSEDDLAEYYYRLTSPQRSIQVRDYLPKTTLAGDIEGAISIEEKNENSAGLGITLAGVYAGAAKAAADANLGVKHSKTVRYDKLPPLESLTASGTIDRGTGAFFKLRPSSRTSLEGGNEFVLMLRVPVEWRADYLQLHCQAAGWRRGPVRALDERVTCGYGDFLIALHLEGDGMARDAALELTSAESRLRRAAAEIAQPKTPSSLAGRLGHVFGGGDTDLPEDWLERVLNRPTRTEVRVLMTQLPPSVREAVVRYFIALRRVETINEPAARPVAVAPRGAGVAAHIE